MSERMLITKMAMDGTTVLLYGARHRWPDLRLFDAAELADVGLDWKDLQPGELTPCRFWAHWTPSEKLNQNGQPYKDVVRLEAMDQPASTTSTDTSAIVDELRTIRQLLEILLQKEPLPSLPATAAAPIPDLCPDCSTRPCICHHLPPSPDPTTGERTDSPITYANGSPVNLDNRAEQDAYGAYILANNAPPQDIDALRTWITDTPNARVSINAKEKNDA